MGILWLGSLGHASGSHGEHRSQRLPIYISGGTSLPVGSGSEYATLRDAWVSTYSFSNVTFVSTQCTIAGHPLPIPSTLGLTQFPVILNSNPFTTVYAGVSNDAGAARSASAMLVAVLMVMAWITV